MKQIIIFLLIIILLIIGFSKYSQYKRYNAPEVNYTTENKIDLNYYNQEVVFNYNEAVESLNNFVMLQWTANEIDVRTPEDDDVETKNALAIYSNKMAKVKYYENLLSQSLSLKEKGLSNEEVQILEKKGIDLETYNRKNKIQKIKSLFNENTKLYNGEKNAIVYEVQKKLKELGYNIQIDGVYRVETLNAIKEFETKNNLLSDGFLDVLTLDYLYK
jgi:hypothetical protein